MKISDLKDKDVWSLFRKGEPGAFSFIYSTYSPALYRYGLKITTHKALVEDALQDIFTELFKNRKKLGPTDNILFYLLKSYKRKLLRRIEAESRYSMQEDQDEYRFEVTWSVEHDLILEEITQRKRELLKEALEKLSPRQREAIYLRFSKELDYASVAGIMNISVEACRNLISKAIRMMKQWVDETGQNPLVLFLAALRKKRM